MKGGCLVANGARWGNPSSPFSFVTRQSSKVDNMTTMVTKMRKVSPFVFFQKKATSLEFWKLKGNFTVLFPNLHCCTLRLGLLLQLVNLTRLLRRPTKLFCDSKVRPIRISSLLLCFFFQCFFFLLLLQSSEFLLPLLFPHYFEFCFFFLIQILDFLYLLSIFNF